MAQQASRRLIYRLARSYTEPLQLCACKEAANTTMIRRSLHGSSRANVEVQRKRALGIQEGRVAVSQPRDASPAASTSNAGMQGIPSATRSQSTDVASASGAAFDIERDVSGLPAQDSETRTSALPSFSFARPKQHPKTAGDLVCTINFSSYSDNLANLTFYTQFCVHAAYAFGLPCSLPSFLPTKSTLRTVPRSPFVHKPSQENFVKKEHKRLLKIYDADMGAVGQFIDYISENSMSGVRIKATTWESRPLGYGKDMVSDTQDLEPTQAQKVKEMAENLLAAGFGEQEGPKSAQAGASAAKGKAGKTVVQVETTSQPVPSS